MKKIILIVTLMLVIVGCKDQRVLHTYYGDFNTDTLIVSYNRDGLDWYKVYQAERDSFYWENKWFYVEGPITIYYCPSSNKYEQTSPDNQGRLVLKEIDPYHRMDWLNN